MRDVYSIGFAIYFILPPFLLWLAGYMSADIFVIIGETRSDREIKRETGVTAMGILIGIAATAAFLTNWSTQRIELAAFVGSITFFLAGVIAYAIVTEESKSDDSDTQADPADFDRALVLSAILTTCTVVPVAVFVLIASRG